MREEAAPAAAACIWAAGRTLGRAHGGMPRMAGAGMRVQGGMGHMGMRMGHGGKH